MGQYELDQHPYLFSIRCHLFGDKKQFLDTNMCSLNHYRINEVQAQEYALFPEEDNLYCHIQLVS